MKSVLGIILVIAYVGNSPLLGKLYPDQEGVYTQFIDAYYLRNKIYEAMFCLFFLACMLGSKGFTRAVFAFGFVMCAASCFDKIILNVSQYLLTDILVVIVAFGAAYYGYKRQRNAGQT